MSESQDTRYLRWFGGTTVIAAVLVLVLNFLVDPYLVFGRSRTPGFNAIKPAVVTHEPIMKAYQASRVQARTIILGSSRAAIGLDPDALTWPADFKPVYNLGVAGSDLGENLRYLDVLLANAPAGATPKRLVVGLDFESFLSRPMPNVSRKVPATGSAAEQAERLAMLAGGNAQSTPGGKVSLRRAKDAASALLTMDALLDSVGTVVSNVRRTGPDFKANGKVSESQLRAWTLAGSPHELFEQKHRLVQRQYQPPRQWLGDTADGPIRGLRHLDLLFNMARQRGLALILIVQPSHVSHHEHLFSLGYWDDFERWKRALTATAASARASGLNVTLMDLGTYDAAFAEPVYRRNQGPSTMRNFWDPVHYSTALGAQLIEIVTSVEPSGPSLGAALAPDTVDAWLLKIRQDRLAYRHSHPAEVEETRRLVCGAVACQEGP